METKDFGQRVNKCDADAILRDLGCCLDINDPIDEFIGAHPVTLTLANIKNLLEKDYLVCEKSDGIRVCLIVYKGTVFLYDRKNIVYVTKYVIPKASDIYVFDGEMYFEDKAIYILALFDALVYKSKNMTRCNLYKRLECTNKFVADLQKIGIFKQNCIATKDFRICPKNMIKSYGFFQILKEIASLKHDNDGLIFTPVQDPYLMNKRSKIFKWKPSHLNTVDFKIKMFDKIHMIYGLYVQVSENQIDCRKGNQSMEKLIGVYYDTANQDIDQRIGEFSYDSTLPTINYRNLSLSSGGWVLHKIRTDKMEPNNIKVALNILNSIEENISEEKLITYWKEMHNNYKARQLAEKSIEKP
ncbi:mRNA guanylyltransferase [Enteropsectra breve]|nr:mRNA guanylyltransferase [Enteropsectra breve]